MNHHKKNRGFTLLELLVVVAIIGLLASVILASLSKVREKARDSYRRQALVQLRTALELYRDKNNAYPSTSDIWYTSDPAGDPGLTYSANWIPGLVASGAISALPNDPLGGIPSFAPCSTGYHRAFIYRSTSGSGYKLMSHCAPETTVSATDVFADGAPFFRTYVYQVCAGVECTY